MTTPAYDPRTVPAWARETIAQIAREHPEDLAFHLGHVAEIEAARRHPPLSEDPRDLLHLAAIEAWQALATGEPAPDVDPLALHQAIYEAFETSGDGGTPIDQLYCTWDGIARQHGFIVHTSAAT